MEPRNLHLSMEGADHRIEASQTNQSSVYGQQQNAAHYEQQQNVSCDPGVLNLAAQACNKLDRVRAQATELYHQAQTAVDSAHRERDYTRDQAQQLQTEAPTFRAKCTNAATIAYASVTNQGTGSHDSKHAVWCSPATHPSWHGPNST